MDRCIEIGLVSGKHLSTDGTSVKADASITSFEPIYPKRTIEEFAAEIEIELSGEKQEVEEPSNNTPPAIRIFDKPSSEVKSDKSSKRRGEKDFHGQKITNKFHRSTTDPDALLYRKAKGQEAHPRYIGQNTIDTKSRVILATGMYAARTSSETTAAIKHIDHIKDRFGLEVETLAADALYGSTTMLREMDKRDITLHAPLLAGEKKEQPPVYKRNTKDLNLFEKRCQKAKDISLRNQQRDIQKTHPYAISHRLRIRSEHIFAESKEHHGFRNSRYRGLEKQQEQANLTAVVQNLKRIVAFLGRNKAQKIALAKTKQQNISFISYLSRFFSSLAYNVSLEVLLIKNLHSVCTISPLKNFKPVFSTRF
ncbi:MAG: transposase [Thermodesulfobacteriota bacterium]|nr:transposase [Thermodesulfobacteriota bacterium]